jgi:hypothetical protein
MAIKLILFVHLLLSEIYETSKAHVGLIVEMKDEGLRVNFMDLLSEGNSLKGR